MELPGGGLKLPSGVLELPSGSLKLPSGVSLDFSGPALIMAIVNCNEDSFYPPSRALRDEAVRRALSAEEEGASIVDFGGESTRPGFVPVREEDELRRVIPVIEAFRKRSSLPVSVDTRKAKVAREALAAGADIINDISSLTDDPLMAEVCAETGAAVVLMHSRDITKMPAGTLAGEVGAFLKAAGERAIAAGIQKGKIIVDPGIGFGKDLRGNLEILRRLPYLAEICGKDYPLLVGLSRKSFIGEITGQDVLERLPGTLAANGAAIMDGADIIRVHDVKEHRDLVKMLYALRREPPQGQ